MTQEEFKNICCGCGYCTKKTAEKYIMDTGKETFDEDDVIEVHRIEQNAKSARTRYERYEGKFRNYQGVKSTKHLKYPTY